MSFAVLAGREFRLLFLMAVLVFAGAWASSRLSADAGGASCIWIANAVISAFALVAPKRWKIYYIVTGVLAALAVDLAAHAPLAEACWFAVANAAEVLLGVLALGHISGRDDITNRAALCKIAYFGVLLAPFLGALLGAPVVAIIENRSWPEVLRLWFLSEALGAAATLPALLFILTRRRRKHVETDRRYLALLVAWASPLAIVTIAVFWQTKYPIVFLLFPPLIAMLFRFRLEGAVFGTSLVVIVAAAFTAEGHGPFRLFHPDPPMEQVMLFHIFGLTLFATAISFGFSAEQRHLLALALKNASGKLSELAYRDGLTGILNRRSFDEALEYAWSNADGSDLSLLYIDIDFFKLFNDTYGHQNGDECLRKVAGTLAECVRTPGDCVARYGGEEFIVLLPKTSEGSAHATAERISGAIRGLKIPHESSPFGGITVSVGIATLCPDTRSSPSGLVRLADNALYRAKRDGRNKIVTTAECMDRECVLT